MASTSGRIETGLISGTTRFYFQWQQVSQNASTGTTKINWQTGINIIANGYWGSNAIKINTTHIDGNVVSNGGTWSNIGGNGDHELQSGTTDLQHTPTGEKTFDAYISGWLYGAGNAEVSGGWVLTPIASYPTFTKHVLKSKTTNKLVIEWASDIACDAVQYTTNNGLVWATPAVGSYPTYEISGLEPNKTYTIKTRIKGTTSQLWTVSTAIIATTYDIARIQTYPTTITIGDNIPMTITNPAGCTMHVLLTYFGVEVLSRTTGVTNDYTYIFTDTEIKTLQKVCAKHNINPFKLIVRSYTGSTKIGDDSKDILIKWKPTVKYQLDNTIIPAILWCRPDTNSEWKQAPVFIKDLDTWKPCI